MNRERFEKIVLTVAGVKAAPKKARDLHIAEIFPLFGHEADDVLLKAAEWLNTHKPGGGGLPPRPAWVRAIAVAKLEPAKCPRCQGVYVEFLFMRLKDQKISPVVLPCGSCRGTLRSRELDAMSREGKELVDASAYQEYMAEQREQLQQLEDGKIDPEVAHLRARLRVAEERFRDLLKSGRLFEAAPGHMMTMEELLLKIPSAVSARNSELR